MKENNNENNSRDTGHNVERDIARSLATNLLKNANLNDLNSIMQLTAGLLKNEKMMNSSGDSITSTKEPKPAKSEDTDKQGSIAQSSLSKKLGSIIDDITQLKVENEENAALNQKLENIANDMSELKKDILELSSLCKRLEYIAGRLS